MADKITKRKHYEMVMEVVEQADFLTDDQKVDYTDFLQGEIDALDAKAKKAAERAAAKRAAGDELRAVVQSVLTYEPQTIDQITAQIEDEDITRAKVIARLTQLVDTGIAEKEDVKSEDGRKIKAYKLADASEVAE